MMDPQPSSQPQSLPPAASSLPPSSSSLSVPAPSKSSSIFSRISAFTISSPTSFVDLERPQHESKGRSSSRRPLIFMTTALVLSLMTIVALFVALIVASKQNRSSSSTCPSPTLSPSSLTFSTVPLATQIDSIRNISLDPCVDFYQYACGQWLANTPIPPEASRFGISFDVIGDRNSRLLLAILEEDWPVIGPFYQACMDTDRIDAMGNTLPQPLTDLLAAIPPSPNLSTYLPFLGSLYLSSNVHPLWAIDFLPHPFQPATNVLYLNQAGGITIKAFASYTNPTTIAKLTTHITNIFSLAGDSAADAQANAALAVSVERQIASFNLPPAQLRDPFKITNPYTLSQFSALTGGALDLTAYVAALTGSQPSDSFTVIVNNPQYFVQLAAFLSSVDPAALYQYTRWYLMHALVDDLSQPYRQESFYFYGATLGGLSAPNPRWRFCTTRADVFLGDVTGRIFMTRAFNGSSMLLIREIIGQIKVAMKQNLLSSSSNWIDGQAKATALEKLELMIDLVGGSDKWQDYHEVNININNHMANIVALRGFAAHRASNRLAQPADRTRWQMTSPTVNAYYESAYNSINFPAGILQAPFFDQSFLQTMNFAGIGMVISHEITHAFDDQGALYNALGALDRWWTNATSQHFHDKAQCFVDQYATQLYQTSAGTEPLNGELTLGENIADNGGVHLSYMAFKNFQRSNPALANVLPPNSPPLENADQLFFISFAQSWCRLYKPQGLHTLIQTDVHSPSPSRVNVPLMNRQEFADAFHCPVGSPMNPENKCQVW